MSLRACAACKRLVRGERTCPFCSAAQPATFAAGTKLGRASRGALLFSAAVAIGGPVDACKRIFGVQSTEAAYGGPPMTIYGGPPPTFTAPVLAVPDAGAVDAADAGGAVAEAGVKAHPTRPPF
ncbi:hypothetical protein BH09MYX1_BH09MYX1_68390 [soil metagenome]